MSIVNPLGQLQPAILNGKDAPIPASSASTMVGGRKITKNLYLPAIQKINYAGRIETVMHVTTSSIPATAFTTGAQFDFILKAKSMKRITGLEIEYKITEINAASMILCPTPYFIERMEIWSQAGGTQQITRQYGDTLAFKTWSLLTREQLDLKKRYENFSDQFGSSTSQTHKASEVRKYRFQFMDNVLELLNCDLQALENDIIIRFYFRNGIVVSGSGVPSLTDLRVIATESDDNGNLENEMFGLKLIKNNIMACQFLSPQQVELSTNTLTQGSEFNFTLKALKGLCSFLTLHVRASGSQASSAATSSFLTNNVDLGPNALIDLRLTSGGGLIGNGTPVPADTFLYSQWIKHFPSDLPRHQFIYFIPFCRNAQRAIEGQLNNYLKFDDSEKALYITPDNSAPVSETHTITASGTSASGSYQLAFRDWVSDTLAYNASTATIASALNAADGWFARNNLTCSASATLATSSVITIAPTTNSNGNLEKLDGSLIRVVSNNMQTSAPAQVTFASSRSAVGRRGFTTGSYSISVYGWMLDTAFLNNGGVTSDL
jgi:hypothetical protein